MLGISTVALLLRIPSVLLLLRVAAVLLLGRVTAIPLLGRVTTVLLLGRVAALRRVTAVATLRRGRTVAGARAGAAGVAVVLLRGHGGAGALHLAHELADEAARLGLLIGARGKLVGEAGAAGAVLGRRGGGGDGDGGTGSGRRRALVRIGLLVRVGVDLLVDGRGDVAGARSVSGRGAVGDVVLRGDSRLCGLIPLRLLCVEVAVGPSSAC